MKASTNGSDDGRASRPTSTWPAPVNADERVAHEAGDVLVDLLGIDAPDVVGLEDRVE